MSHVDFKFIFKTIDSSRVIIDYLVFIYISKNGIFTSLLHDDMLLDLIELEIHLR